ncbi:DNA glycosylase AlkZ-like family protein [Pseudoxanthomonas suwonensis]|uniref:DNA glycosylase AlkZ-like family protein n=1 Tax=Pseudoxanthomonas suwonensis TaxID=314722 RepID=UPI0009E5F844|nr:crosslink repair DNA glycosylase YcaQ family protein [Pseudoxanthomonas suwonensis]
MSAPTLDALRRYAVARTLFAPTTLPRAIQRLGFVQADPIRAPARAQDLTLRHRVRDYCAGDLERRYPRLAVEEDCLVNYGFLPREHLGLMHPRRPSRAWDAGTRRRAADVLAFVREHGPVHPRDVQRHFAHGRVTNYWGGSSNASTHLLDGMHYRGMLRVQRRESGTRIYEVAAHPPADDSPAGRARCAAALVELVVRKYAPLPAASLTYLVRLLDYGAPQLSVQTRAALRLARERLASHRIDGTVWYWPADEDPASRRHAPDAALRLLAPFDPVVWDRRRFTLLWDWTYRFEAYTPEPKRRLGYYALPMLWREHVVGWANLVVREGRLQPDFGYVGATPKGTAFRNALDDELQRMACFLGSDDRRQRRTGSGPARAADLGAADPGR